MENCTAGRIAAYTLFRSYHLFPDKSVEDKVANVSAEQDRMAAEHERDSLGDSLAPEDGKQRFVELMQSKNLFAKYEIVDRDVFRDAKTGKMKIKLKRLSNEVEFFVDFESINASNIVERLRKASNMTQVRAA